MKNNPYNRTADSYGYKLRLPVIRTFRKKEKYALSVKFNQLISRGDSVLEFGCGDGYYTGDIIGRCREVTAIDGSRKMLDMLRGELGGNLEKLKTIEADISSFIPKEKYDVVVSVGLMDYLPDWKDFLHKAFSSSRRGIILTCPALTLPGLTFKTLALLEGSRIQLLSSRAISTYLKASFPKWEISIELVGLNSGMSGGLTWIIAGIKDPD